MMLFCNIARMTYYRGRTNVDVPEGAGNHPQKEEVNNFYPHGGHVYGYVAAGTPSISLERLGATDRSQPSVGGIDVVWTAPSKTGGRDVVGWYRDATVFSRLQQYERGYYHVKASKTNYVLLPPDKRTLNLQSAQIQPGGFGRNVWYANTAYGRRIRKRVNELFGRTVRQVFDRVDLEDQANALQPLSQAPRGVRNPSRIQREITAIGRNPEVRRWILQCADGRCELCGKRAPFVKEDGSPYLEIHHIRQLAHDGDDAPDNAVALCPNCHREAHSGARKQAIEKQLRKRALGRSRR